MGVEVAKTDVEAEASDWSSVVAVKTMLDSKSGRADMLDGEEIEGCSLVDIGVLSSSVKDAISTEDVEIRLADDLRRKAANFVRFETRGLGELLNPTKKRQ